MMAGPEQQRFQRLALLFEEAVKVPPGPERERYLDHECGAGTELRGQVVRLLVSDAKVQQRASA